MFKSYPHFKSFVKTIQDFTKGRKVKLSELAEKMSHELCGAEVSTLKALLDNQSKNKEESLPTSIFTAEQMEAASLRLCGYIYDTTGNVISEEDSLKAITEIMIDQNIIKEKQKDTNQDNTKSVFLLEYSSEESIIVFDGKIITSSYICNKIKENPYVNGNIDILKAGQDIAKKNNTSLKVVKLPTCLSNYTPRSFSLDKFDKFDKFDKDSNMDEVLSHYEPILKLAENMGCFKYEKTIFDMLEDTSNKIFIEDYHCKSRIEDDWKELIEEEEKNNGYEDNGEDAIVWRIDWEIEDGIIDVELSFRELCKAERLSETKWLIDGQYSFVLTFLE